MTARRVAARHARDRARLAAAMRRQARLAWAKVDRDSIFESWSAQVPRLLVVLTAGQRAAAATADPYVTGVLAEQDAAGAQHDEQVNPDAFAGVASDGRDLATLLQLPAIVALTAIRQGRDVERAVTAGGALAELAAHTQTADAGRVADQVALVGRRHATGYVRMIVGATCSRCIVLAGRRYGWNAAFKRHPHCDCVHIPTAEDTADDLRTDPRKAFAAMTAAEQDRVFTKVGAQAIRDGADMNQVVNARRGANGLTPAGARITADEARMLRGGRDIGRLQPVNVFGRDLFVTTEGTTTRGVAGVRLDARNTGTKTKGGRYRSARAPRLMPESIYQIAGNDRAEAIRLLRRFGYIT